MSSSSLCICVPSKGRVDLLKKKTLKILEHTNVPWYVFVEPQEASRYAEIIGIDQMVVLPEDDGGMSVALDWMKTFCMTEGYDFCFKMDDDVNHWYNNPRVSSKEDQGKFLDDIETLLTEALSLYGDKLGGLSFPQKFFHGDWRNFTHMNKMLEGLYIIRAKDWYVPLDLRGNHEEFVASAHLIHQGKVILRVGKYCWDANMSTLPGGFQSFDRVEEQRKDYEDLERVCPHLLRYTRRREYTQKSGDVFVVTDKSYFNRLLSKKILEV